MRVILRPLLMIISPARENTYVVGEVVTVFGRRGGCDVNGSDDKNGRETGTVAVGWLS